jgi:hypothetical protein
MFERDIVGHLRGDAFAEAAAGRQLQLDSHRASRAGFTMTSEAVEVKVSNSTEMGKRAIEAYKHAPRNLAEA